MNLGFLFNLKFKKAWWIDIVFYFVASLLVATFLCYLIFIAKIYLQKKQIADLDIKIATVGTDEQKQQEKMVFRYQKKIADFAKLIENHKMSLNIFTFFEKETLPNIWFDRFSMNEKDGSIILSGEADSNETLSHQTDSFEKNEYVKEVSLLNFSNGTAGRVTFNMNLSFKPEIFIPKITPIEQSQQLPAEQQEQILQKTGEVIEQEQQTAQ
jgi:hypothetical protein